MEKFCRFCSQTKPISDFYRHPKMADGYSNKCKECQKRASTAARNANLERYRQYDRERADLPHRMEARASYAKTEAGRASVAKAREKWEEENAVRRAAHIILGNAIKSGRVDPWPACAVPDCDCSPEAHHPDYSHPLDVVWLCSKHHKQLHREHRAYLRQQQGKEAA